MLCPDKDEPSTTVLRPPRLLGRSLPRVCTDWHFEAHSRRGIHTLIWGAHRYAIDATDISSMLVAGASKHQRHVCPMPGASTVLLAYLYTLTLGFDNEGRVQTIGPLTCGCSPLCLPAPSGSYAAAGKVSTHLSPPVGGVQQLETADMSGTCPLHRGEQGKACWQGLEGQAAAHHRDTGSVNM